MQAHGRLLARRVRVSSPADEPDVPCSMNTRLPGPDGTVATRRGRGRPPASAAESDDTTVWVPDGPGAPVSEEQIPRLMTVWFPNWSVLAAADQTQVPLRGPTPAPAEPVAVLRGNRVLAVSLTAEAEGVRLGLADARPSREAQGCDWSTTTASAMPVGSSRSSGLGRAVGPPARGREPGRLTFATRGPSRSPVATMPSPIASPGVALAGLARSTGTRSARARYRCGGPADGRFAAAVAARHAATVGRAIVVPPGQAASEAFLAPLPAAGPARRRRTSIEARRTAPPAWLRRLGELADARPRRPARSLRHRWGTAHRFARAADDRAAEYQRPASRARHQPGLRRAGDPDRIARLPRSPIRHQLHRLSPAGARSPPGSGRSRDGASASAVNGLGIARSG